MGADREPGTRRPVQAGVTTARLVGGAAGYTGALVVAAAAGFINVRLSLEYLGTAQYGLLLLASTISGWGILGNLGLGDAIRQRMTGQLAKDEVEDAARVLSSGVVTLGGIGVALFLGFWVLHETGTTRVLLQGDIDDVPRAARLLLLGVALFLLRFPFNPLGAVVLARNQLVAHNVFSMLFSATRPLILWLTLERTTSLEVLLIVQSVHQWFDLMLRYGFVLTQVPGLRVRPRFASLAIARSLVVPSLSFLVISLGVMVIYSTDNAVISTMVGVEYIAGYAAAFRLFTILRQISTSGIEVLFPAAAILRARGEEARLRAYVLGAGRFALALSVLAAVGLAFLGRPVIHAWLGDELDHPPGVAVIAVLAAILPVGVLINSLGRAITGVGRHHRQAMIFVFEIALNLGLSITLARQHGVLGVALGTLISRSVVTLAHGADAVFTLGLRPTVIIGRMIVPAGAIATPLVALGLVAPVPVDIGLAALFLCIGGYGGLCVLALWFILPRSARTRLRSRLGGSRRSGGSGAAPGGSAAPASPAPEECSPAAETPAAASSRGDEAPDARW